MLVKYQRTYMSGERFLLFTANFNFVIVYLGNHVTPKRISKTRGGRRFFGLNRIDLKVEQEGGSGGVPRDTGGVNSRKRDGKEGKKG